MDKETFRRPVWNSVYQDINILLIVGMIFLIMDVLLKKPLEEPMEKLRATFKESGISE